MKINRRYIVFVIILIGIYIAFQLSMPRQFNWSPTFHHYDKNPYGTFVLNEVFEKRFDTVIYSYETLYEMKDEPDANILIIADYFSLDQEDLETLLSKIDSGSHVLIAAEYFDYKLQDTLGFVSDWLHDLYNLQSELNPTETDSIFFQIAQADIESKAKYNFPWQIGQIEFSEYDSLNAKVFAVNERDNPVVIRHQIGKGELILCSTPLIFTNYSLLLDNNYQLAEQIFSLMGDSSLKWIHYYHLGRMESPSPLRYVLGQVPLKWAFYLTIATIFLFMIFEAKRTQRIIPVIRPLPNYTLDFTKVIGKLYYQKKNHKDLAWKKIVIFHDYVISHYFIDIFEDDIESALAHKSGQPIDETKKLLEFINRIKNQEGQITKEELFNLTQTIDKFYYHKI